MMALPAAISARMDTRTEEIVAMLKIMRIQEERGYKCQAYLSYPVAKRGLKRLWPGCSNPPVDAECRFKMAKWCFQVVEFCKFSNETVAVAMSYLDRYLSTDDGRRALDDRKVFQLVAMTCLYVAIKIHEPEAIHPSVVAQLSQGAHTEQEVKDMEIKLLLAIEWRMNPPTAISFIDGFFSLLPQGALCQIDREVVYELAQYQAELAVNEYSLVCVGASTIAYCAVLNALETVAFPGALKWMGILADVASIDILCPSISSTQEKLCQAASGAWTMRPATRIIDNASTQKHFVGRRGSVDVSPRMSSDVAKPFV